MNQFSDKQPDFIRDKLIGLGEHSIRKNYYPELQKRLEELETFRNLLDKVNDGILMVRLPSGAIVDANEAACSILGFSREELFDSCLTDLFPTAEAVLQSLDRMPDCSGRRQEFSTEFRRINASR